MATVHLNLLETAFLLKDKRVRTADIISSQYIEGHKKNI